MKVRELLHHWEQQSSGAITPETFAVKLPVEDAAKLRALADMYPRRSLEGLITDLLTAALGDLESSLPYQKGNRVVALDEEGDPLFEDIGPTPRYLDLKRKHMDAYRKGNKTLS